MTITLFCCYRSHIAFFLSDSLALFLPVFLHTTFPFPSAPSLLSLSDYIIKEKTVLLQKKDNEGFGFVLRGAKGESLLPNSPQIFPSVQIFQSHWLFFSVSNLSVWSLKPTFLLSVSTHAHPFCLVLCSSDSHRGVHSNASVPRAAVPGVCR